MRAALLRGVTVAALAALAATAAPAAAQVASLDAVDSLATAGRYAEARATLDRWWAARDLAQVPGGDQVRALMLRARLQTDPAAAENDYLAVVIGHPTSPHAPQALLRLGQNLLITGQPARAAGYLQRLTADYPGRPERTTALLWLARAETAARHPAAACRAARAGLADAGGDAELAAMLRLEEAAACAIASGDPAGSRTGAAPAPGRESAPRQAAATPPQPGQDARAEARPGARTGAFAVQTGAFRYREGADALMARLRAAGHEPRAVLVPRNTLLRVRIGRFATAAEAAALAQSLKRRGFDAVVVSDAAEERAP